MQNVFIVETPVREVGKLRRKDDNSLFQELYRRYDPLLFQVAARYFPDATQNRGNVAQNGQAEKSFGTWEESGNYLRIKFRFG